MEFEPGRHRVCVPIGQQIDDAIALKVADNRAVTLAAAPRPVVDADNPRWRQRLEARSADQPQQSVPADRHRQPVRQP